MKLQHIDLNDLRTTRLNVRKKGARDIADILPSIRAQGLLQPLLVRPNCEGYEIIAGQRRYHALKKLAEENEGSDSAPVPCLVMEVGDDAKAVEASLAENIARLPINHTAEVIAYNQVRLKAVSGEVTHEQPELGNLWRGDDVCVALCPERESRQLLDEHIINPGRSRVILFPDLMLAERWFGK